MRALISLFAVFLPATALAGEIDISETWDKPSVMYAIDPLIVRAEPSLDAPAVVEMASMAILRILDDTGPVVTVDGRQDRWVLVAAPFCIEKDCKRLYTGWVLDSHLGYEDRFAPLAGRPAALLTGHAGTSAFSYAIEPDGRFTGLWARCSAGACSVTPRAAWNCADFEEKRAGFCAVSGRLYRYRDTVVGKNDAGKRVLSLKLDDSGELCAYDSERFGAERMCERSGPFAALGGPDPKSAVEAVMAMQRKRLALVAADMLNLRAEPSTGADIVTRVPRGSQVTVLEPGGPAVAIGDAADRWVKIRIDNCYSFLESGLCTSRAIGWAVDGFLAYEDRLAPVTGWRAGMIGGYGGDYGFSYLFLEDGSVEYTESCGDYREGRSCTVEGRLYRYRNLVVARIPSTGAQHILSIDAQGRLCFPLAEAQGDIIYETGDGRSTRCDR